MVSPATAATRHALPDRWLTLCSFVLAPTDLGDGTAKAFAGMMPRNTALSTLDLTATGITAAGVTALKAGLKASTANPYLVLFADGLPHLQWTSWQEKGKENAP